LQGALEYQERIRKREEEEKKNEMKAMIAEKKAKPKRAAMQKQLFNRLAVSKSTSDLKATLERRGTIVNK